MKTIIKFVLYCVLCLFARVSVAQCDAINNSGRVVTIKSSNATKEIVKYRIQLMRLRHNTSDGFTPDVVVFYQHCSNTWVVISASSYNNKAEASAALSMWIKNGYYDAFVYIEKTFINVDESQEYSKSSKQDSSKVQSLEPRTLSSEKNKNSDFAIDYNNKIFNK